MNKFLSKSLLTFAHIVAMLSGVETVKAQNVNMNNHITLTVSSGQSIELDLTLKELVCYGNQINQINVSSCAVLNSILCDGNNLDACEFDDISHQLPNREPNKNAVIYIKGNDAVTDNTGADGCRDTIATNKGWKVRNIHDIDIINANYTCNTTNTNEIEQYTAISICPNPVQDIMYIETEAKVLGIHIYNLYGLEVTSVENTAEIKFFELLSGVYYVWIITDKEVKTL